MKIKSIFDIILKDKKVLLRLDLNVPINNQKITSDQRILAVLPTIKHCLKEGSKLMLTSHLGRPKEGEYNDEFSLKPIADYLSKVLNRTVKLKKNWLDEQQIEVQSGGLIVLENVRFNVGESANDEHLSKKIASLCDVFVMDAFATAHRAQASTVGVAQFAKEVCAGPLMFKEVEALNKIFTNPQRPLLALVGGAKVSTKLSVLESLADKVDILIVGGGITNTFLLAQGFEVGKSICEPSLLDIARRLNEKMASRGASISLPVDVKVSPSMDGKEETISKAVENIAKDDIIVDLGEQSINKLKNSIAQAKTIIWNGPVGIFEVPEFASGTAAITHAIADSSAFSVAGGGDTISALEVFKRKNDMGYISTAGGAFLEFLEGKTLPAIKILIERNQQT